MTRHGERMPPSHDKPPAPRAPEGRSIGPKTRPLADWKPDPDLLRRLCPPPRPPGEVRNDG